MKNISIRYQLAIFLALFAIFVAFKDHNKLFILNAAIAAATATLVEFVLRYFKQKTFNIHDSAIISGLIIGFVLADNNHWWIFCIAATIAILSKYIIRFHNRHIFNPAAFGIFLTSIILSSQTQWHGTFLWYILLPAGLYFSYKIQRLEILLGYAVVSLVLFGTQALIHHVNLLSIIGYFSYFYIFIMVVEPKTTPYKKIGKLIFGGGIALTIFVLSNFNINFEIELVVLLVFNILVQWLNKIPERRII